MSHRRRVADVKISRIPQNLVGGVFLTTEEEENNSVDLIFYRWDKYEYLGWDPFKVKLEFSDGQVREVTIPASNNLKDCHTFRVAELPSITPLAERPLQEGRRIPRKVWNLSAPVNKQLSQQVRRLLENIREMNRLLQCTSEYKILEDEDALREVRNSGIENFISAYDLLRPGAYKADLMRYWLLYKYGGVYFDDKTFPRYSLDSEIFDKIFINPETKRACDFFIGVSGKIVEIAFMGARPGSPIMLTALKTAIDNIISRRYTEHQLGITGNRMLQGVFNGKIGGSSSSRRVTWIEHEGENVALLSIAPSDEKIILEHDIFWQRQPIPRADWPRPKTHYSNLWKQRQIYRDGNIVPIVPQIISTETKREIIVYTIMFFVIIGVGFLISLNPELQSWF